MECRRAAGSAIRSWIVPRPGSSVGVVADELRKLAGLRNEGILTPQEFEAQKTKLLTR